MTVIAKEFNSFNIKIDLVLAVVLYEMIGHYVKTILLNSMRLTKWYLYLSGPSI